MLLTDGAETLRLNPRPRGKSFRPIRPVLDQSIRQIFRLVRGKRALCRRQAGTPFGQAKQQRLAKPSRSSEIAVPDSSPRGIPVRIVFAQHETLQAARAAKHDDRRGHADRELG